MSRLKDLKKATVPVDAEPLIRQIIEDAKHMTDDERKTFKEKVLRGFESAGELLLERAYLEKVLTPFEFADIFTKHGLDVKDLGVVLQAYFGGKQVKSDDIQVLTMPDSAIYKAKGFIKERFGVNVILMSNVMEKYKEGDPKAFEEFAKENKLKPDELIKKMRQFENGS